MYVADGGFNRGFNRAFAKLLSTENPSNESPSGHFATYKGPS